MNDERLTQPIKHYYGEQQNIRRFCYMGFDGDCQYSTCVGCTILKVYRKLSEYETAEQEGRLVVLPCKVGDTVYEVNGIRNLISELRVAEIEIGHNMEFTFIKWKLISGVYTNTLGFMSYDIGKTVFLTREEADQALKEVVESDKI